MVETVTEMLETTVARLAIPDIFHKALKAYIIALAIHIFNLLESLHKRPMRLKPYLQPLTSLGKAMDAILSRLRFHKRSQLKLWTIDESSILYRRLESQNFLKPICMQLCLPK